MVAQVLGEARPPPERVRADPWPDVEGAAGPRAPLSDWLLANRMVYGLVNVRTDGERIVIGVLKESDSTYQVEELTP